MDNDLCKFISRNDDGIRVCREERQYALFLYNILLAKMMGCSTNETAEKIINNCIIGKDNDCKDMFSLDAVYYEVTFMRDYFIKDRERIFSECGIDSKNISSNIKKMKFVIDEDSAYNNSFNEYLIKFVLGKMNVPGYKKEVEEALGDLKFHNLGNREVKRVIKEKWGPDCKSYAEDQDTRAVYNAMYMASAMMQSKPDIAVIYHKKDNKKKLRLFECKYLSNETLKNELSQRMIQSYISEFICSLSNNIKSDTIIDRNHIIRFVDEESNYKNYTDDIVITISDLLLAEPITKGYLDELSSTVK